VKTQLCRVNILDATGHTELRWDPEKPDECAGARETIQALKRQGFVFFLTDGRPADEVTAGDGMVLVRRLSPVEIESVVTERENPGEPDKPGRGRPHKATGAPSPSIETSSEAAPEVVAIRQQRGG